MTTFEIHTGIDLHDIQGNIVKGYGRYGFPFARYVFFEIRTEAAGRRFARDLIPLVTTSAPWTRFGDASRGTKRPEVTTNVAFTYSGLRRLGLPDMSLHSFPDDFSMGMRARTAILGDNGSSAPEHWDPIWQSNERAQVVDVLVTINASTPDIRELRYQQILEIAASPECSDGVAQLFGHRNADGDNGRYQDGAALGADEGMPSAKEHFGYTDGISDPYFKESGSYPTYVVGGGKRVRGASPEGMDGWKALATGEFVLGHVDEADEYPAAPIPSGLSANGTFLVYRKLHENVAAFDQFLDSAGAAYGNTEEFAAKLAGRWRSGAPLTTFPTQAEADAYMAEFDAANAERRSGATKEIRDAAKTRYYDLKQHLNSFDYGEDLAGGKCPVGAHIRRANPRGALEFGNEGAFAAPGALVDRRRIARRGIPYGKATDRSRNDGDHGIIFMAINASISRQFEFVQQQWMNYGNDFKLGSDRDALIGNHGPDGGRMTIETEPGSGKPPHFCGAIPRFVETRGGDYFFVPSLTALDSIARGTVDPT